MQKPSILIRDISYWGFTRRLNIPLCDLINTSIYSNNHNFYTGKVGENKGSYRKMEKLLQGFCNYCISKNINIEIVAICPAWRGCANKLSTGFKFLKNAI